MHTGATLRRRRHYLGLRTRAQCDSLALARPGEARYLAPILDWLIEAYCAYPAPPGVADVQRALNWLAGAAGAPRDDMPSVATVRDAYAHAMRHWVLTFRESAVLAVHALRTFDASACLIDLACVKEGHTSSVWRAAFRGTATDRQRVIGILVPRDVAADAEQTATMDHLAALRARLGDRIMGEYARLAPCAERGVRRRRFRVAVVEWLENARELHVVAAPADAGEDDDGTSAPRVIVVDSFTGGDRPVGRSADASESADILAACRELLLATAEPTLDGGITVPRVEPNDGDFVLDGDTVRLVATSRPGPPRTAAEAIREYALLAARSSATGGAIYLAPPPVLAAELRARFPAECLRAGAAELLAAADHPRVCAVAGVLALMDA